MHISQCRPSVRNAIVLIIFIFVAVNIITCLPVSAISADSSIDEIFVYAKDELNHPIKFGIFTFLAFKYNNIYQSIKSNEFMFRTSIPAGLSGVVNSISTAVMTIGRLLCFLYFLLDLLEHATRDSFTAEAFVKSLAKLMIMFVIFTPATLDTISSFGAALNELVFSKILNDGLANGNNEKLLDLIDEMKSTSWIKCIGFLFSIDKMLPSITLLLSEIVVLFVGVGRMVELTVYKALVPLGICSIYNGGVNSSGFRYLKKYFALELQGAIMLLVVIAGGLVSQSIGSNLGSLGAITDIVFALATCSIVVKSKSIANDVMGV